MNQEEEEKKLPFIIQYGVGGGVNDKDNYCVVMAKNQEQAETEAFIHSCEIYESYEGSGGVRDLADVMEEEGIEDEGEAQEVYEEEREGWLEYCAVPFSKEEEEKAKNGHYENDFKEITDNL